jgi:hypothetical protein
MLNRIAHGKTPRRTVHQGMQIPSGAGRDPPAGTQKPILEFTSRQSIATELAPRDRQSSLAAVRDLR